MTKDFASLFTMMYEIYQANLKRKAISKNFLPPGWKPSRMVKNVDAINLLIENFKKEKAPDADRTA